MRGGLGGPDASLSFRSNEERRARSGAHRSLERLARRQLQSLGEVGLVDEAREVVLGADRVDAVAGRGEEVRRKGRGSDPARHEGGAAAERRLSPRRGRRAAFPAPCGSTPGVSSRTSPKSERVQPTPATRVVVTDAASVHDSRRRRRGAPPSAAAPQSPAAFAEPSFREPGGQDVDSCAGRVCSARTRFCPEPITVSSPRRIRPERENPRLRRLPRLKNCAPPRAPRAR